MKKMLSVIIATIMVLTIIPAGIVTASASNACGDYLYSIVDDSTATIIGYTGTGGEITIPDNLDNYPVTVIGSNAFNGCNTLTVAIIPNTVISIGNNAFDNCSEMKRVTIGSGVTSIGNSAFNICPKLRAAYFLGNAPQIGSLVFGPGSNATYAQAYRTTLYYLVGSTGFEDTPYYGYDPYPPYGYILPGGEYPPYITYPPGSIGIISPGFPSHRWNGYGTATFWLTRLVLHTNSPAIIDSVNSTIYGLTAGITQSEFESNFVQIDGFGNFIYTFDSGKFGTGTKVEIFDKTVNKVVATYNIVVFGDVNGDSNIDSMDAGTLVDVENKAIAWNRNIDTALFKAGDINGDGNIDSMDAGMLIDIENGSLHINQSTGTSF